METRKELLNKLIQFSEPIEGLEKKLSIFPWDSEDYLVTLTRMQISDIINSFLSKKISVEQLRSWANTVEMRDGIEYEPGYEKLIAHALFELSTPEINDPINEENLKRIQTNLMIKN